MEKLNYNKVPRWIKHAERNFRKHYKGFTYHGVPLNIEKNLMVKHIYILLNMVIQLPKELLQIQHFIERKNIKIKNPKIK